MLSSSDRMHQAENKSSFWKPKKSSNGGDKRIKEDNDIDKDIFSSSQVEHLKLCQRMTVQCGAGNL